MKFPGSEGSEEEEGEEEEAEEEEEEDDWSGIESGSPTGSVRDFANFDLLTNEERPSWSRYSSVSQ